MAAQVQPIESVAPTLTVKSDIGEDLLAVAYLRMKTEQLLQMVFWEKAPTLKSFLEWCAAPNSVIVGCFTETDRSNVGSPPLIELAGLGWLTGITMRGGKRRADAGEVFWRETQAAGLTSQFGRLLLDFAFEEVKASTIYGITPVRNVAAVRFMRHCGFESFGPIPELCCWMGETCDGYISAMTFANWARRKNQP